MAIDTETKRASTLHAGSFYPGNWNGLSEPDGADLGSKAERGFILWHYAGIDAAVPGAADIRNHIIPAYFRANC